MALVLSGERLSRNVPSTVLEVFPATNYSLLTQALHLPPGCSLPLFPWRGHSWVLLGGLQGGERGVCVGDGSEVRGMGRGVVWDLRVINPTLSLTSSQCRNNLVSRDSSSLVESPLGFPRAVCMQDEEDATFWWRLSLFWGFPLPPPHFLLPDKWRGIGHH